MRNQKSIPFYGNSTDNTHCFQAAIRMVLKHFLPKEEFPYDKLDIISKKIKGKGTWPTATMLWLKENGFEIVDIEEFDYQKFIKEGENYLRHAYGDEVADVQIKYSDIDQERKLAREFLKKVSFENRESKIEDISKLMKKGYLLILNVNSNALNNEKGYAGHFVVVTGINNKTITIHDPGLPPTENRIINLTTFEKAWAYPDSSAKNIIAIRKVI